MELAIILCLAAILGGVVVWHQRRRTLNQRRIAEERLRARIRSQNDWRQRMRRQ